MNTNTRVALLGLTLVFTACMGEKPAPAAAPAEQQTVADQPTAMVAPPRSVFDTMRVIHATGPMTGGKEETQPPCDGCAWSDFEMDTPRVKELECIKGGSAHPHCHMTVTNFIPQSDVSVTKVGDKYHFEVVNAVDANVGIDCPALNQHAEFPDVIWGKCVLRHPGLEGDAEHDFAAILEFMESTGKNRIRFVYSHGWSTEPGKHIHNGEGHVHPGGG